LLVARRGIEPLLPP